KIEQAAQQMAFIDLCKDLVKKAGCMVSWETVTPGAKSKDDRIYELEPYFERGLVYLGTGYRFHEFHQQYASFPRGERKDLLDALSQGPAEWRKHHQRVLTPEERKSQELAAYRMRRGMGRGQMTRPNSQSAFDKSKEPSDWELRLRN